MEAQGEDFYKVKRAEYNVQKAEAEKVLHDCPLPDKIDTKKHTKVE